MANECRRQWSCGDASPGGILSWSAGSSLWNVQLMTLGPIVVLFFLPKENTGPSGEIGPDRDCSLCRKPVIALAILGPNGTKRSFPETCLPNDQKLAIQIDILQAQPRHLSDSETQPVQQREYHLVDFAARLCARSGMGSCPATSRSRRACSGLNRNGRRVGVTCRDSQRIGDTDSLS